MFYSPLLNKAASKLTTRGALQYVYQDPNSGEFVASDGKMMLVENNGTPFMAKFWDTITQMPTNCAEEYPNWSEVLRDKEKEAKKLWFSDKVKIKGDFAIVENFYISAKNYQLIQSFIGSDIVINIPRMFSDAIYFRNENKTRQAIILPYKLYPENFDKAEWNVLDNNGNIIYVTKSLKEAELFGLTVKLVGED